MKTDNWLNLDHHEYVVVDLVDGRRIQLEKGDKLLTAIDGVMIRAKNGDDVLYPAVQVVQILKRYKKRYL